MKEAEGTLRVDEQLRNWADAGRARRDAEDAVRIGQAWRQLAPHHRELLRMVYVWRADREAICRRLKIPRRPWQRYELELAAAKDALAQMLRGTSQ